MTDCKIVRAEMGTRSPDGMYAVVRYFTSDGRMFRRTHSWPHAVAVTGGAR